MSYNCDDFIWDVRYGLKLAKDELNARKDGYQGESTIEQLENYIIPDLEYLLHKMSEREELPPNTQR